jgi:hypothetical protein
MEYSFEGDELSGAGEPSFFTAAVVEGLETGKADRDGDRLVSVDELYDYVYDRVRERTLNQSPTKLSSLEGPLYVARSRYEAPVEPAALPQDLMDLIQHPYSGARLSAVEELSTLLSSRNRGLALAGRLSLEQLARDDSRKVSDRVREVLLHHASVNELEEVEPPAGVVAPEPTAPPEKNAALATTEPEAALATIEPEPLRPPAAQALSQTEHETLAGAHTAGAVAIAGAAAVLVSLLGDSNPQQHFAGYWVPVAVMAAGVIALIAYALRSKRSEILLAGAGLAFALLGVTFPRWRPRFRVIRPGRSSAVNDSMRRRPPVLGR